MTEAEQAAVERVRKWLSVKGRGLGYVAALSKVYPGSGSWGAVEADFYADLAILLALAEKPGGGGRGWSEDKLAILLSQWIDLLSAGQGLTATEVARSILSGEPLPPGRQLLIALATPTNEGRPESLSGRRAEDALFAIRNQLEAAKSSLMFNDRWVNAAGKITDAALWIERSISAAEDALGREADAEQSARPRDGEQTLPGEGT